MPRNTVTANIPHNSQKYGHRLRLFQVHEGVMEKDIFWCSHEEEQGSQTKLHPGFTLGKLVQPSPGISILRDSHIVLSKRF